MNSEDPGRRVMIVDDHPLVRDGLRSALRRILPHPQIEEAGSAEEAMQKFAVHRPSLVLIDIDLPGANGLEVVRQIRALDTNVQLLIVAAETDPWTVRAALAAGAAGFMAKTHSGADLAQAVQAVVQGREFLCAQSQAALRQGAQTRNPIPQPEPSILSQRECEIMRYLAQGENTKTIASILQISPKTVETHRSHIMRKLRLNSVVALTRYAIRHGLTCP